MFTNTSYFNTLKALAVSAIMLSACSDNTAEHNHSNPPSAATAQATTAEVQHLHVPKSKVLYAKLQFDTLRTETIEGQVQVNGTLRLPPQGKASISPLMEGVVDKIYVYPGEQVRKGQKLADIKHLEIITLQENYLAARNRQELAELEFKRQKELNAENAGSLRKYQEAESALKTARLEADNLQSRIEVLGLPLPTQGKLTPVLPVVSPISGYVTEIFANTGMFIKSGMKLMEVADADHLHVDLLVYEQDIAAVKVGQRISFTAQGGGKGDAQVVSTGKVLDEATRTTTVHAHIDNEAQTGRRFLPGMYVSGVINTGQRTAQTVPEDAVVRFENANYVFTTDWNGNDSLAQFNMIPVDAGAPIKGRIPILLKTNVQPGVKFVTKGAYYLLAELRKGEGDDPH